MNTMTHLAASAALVGILSLAFGPALADQRMFDDFLHGDTRRAIAHIESGGDPLIRDKIGATLLHWAARAGEIEIARSLLERGVDVDVAIDASVSGAATSTPLMQAVFGEHPRMVGFLLKAGADVKAKDSDGLTALHWAVPPSPGPSMAVVIVLLIEAGAEVDATDTHGHTALHGAAENASPETARVLLEASADVNSGNIYNVTALDRAARYNDAAMLDYLLDAGADPLARRDDPGDEEHAFTPLDGARKHNPGILKTKPGRRLQHLTYEGTGCEGVIVLPGDKKLTILAERTLGRASSWREIAKLNGLGPEKSYRLGDCLKLPD